MSSVSSTSLLKSSSAASIALNLTTEDGLANSNNGIVDPFAAVLTAAGDTSNTNSNVTADEKSVPVKAWGEENDATAQESAMAAAISAAMAMLYAQSAPKINASIPGSGNVTGSSAIPVLATPIQNPTTAQLKAIGKTEDLKNTADVAAASSTAGTVGPESDLSINDASVSNQLSQSSLPSQPAATPRTKSDVEISSLNSAIARQIGPSSTSANLVADNVLPRSKVKISQTEADNLVAAAVSNRIPAKIVENRIPNIATNSDVDRIDAASARTASDRVKIKSVTALAPQDTSIFSNAVTTNDSADTPAGTDNMFVSASIDSSIGTSGSERNETRTEQVANATIEYSRPITTHGYPALNSIAPASDSDTRTAAKEASAPTQFLLNDPPGTAAWNQAFGDRLVWLAGQNLQEARLQLHPKDLGHIDVRLHIERNEVIASFAVQHTSTVTAVQEALPHLQNLLGQHGLTLGQTSVSHQNAQHAGTHGRFQSEFTATSSKSNHENKIETAQSGKRAPLGLLDDFA